MRDHPANRFEADWPGFLGVDRRIGHEQVFTALEVFVGAVQTRQGFGMRRVYALFLAAAPERHVVMAAIRGHSHERLGHEAGDHSHFAGHLTTDLAICGQAVGIAQAVIVHPIQFQLTRRILVIALDHIEPHSLGVFDNFHERRSKAFELVDMVAIGL